MAFKFFFFARRSWATSAKIEHKILLHNAGELCDEELDPFSTNYV